MTEKLAQINALLKNTLMETLDITFTEIGTDFVVAKMPVTPKVWQPMGILHGGATVALAESVGSTASYLLVNGMDYEVKGIEISTNHVKSKKDGIVTATAKMIHKGKTIHLWEIKITDEDGALISICKLTNIVLPKNKTI